MGEKGYSQHGSIEAGGVFWTFNYLSDDKKERLCFEGCYDAFGDRVASWDIVCRENGEVGIKNLDGCGCRDVFDLFNSMGYRDRRKVSKEMCDGAEGLLREVIGAFDVVRGVG